MSKRHLSRRVSLNLTGFTNPQQVKSYLQSQLVGRPNEVFAALFLDNQNRLLAYEELFFGTVNSASSFIPEWLYKKPLNSMLRRSWLLTIIHQVLPSQVLADIDITSHIKTVFGTNRYSLTRPFDCCGQYRDFFG